jgi:hypothetical protein
MLSADTHKSRDMTNIPRTPSTTPIELNHRGIRQCQTIVCGICPSLNSPSPHDDQHETRFGRV